MKKENLNVNLQLLLFPGIGILGLLICLLMKEVYIMPVFYGISLLSRAFFSFSGNIYGKGHWYSKKECILDGLIFIALGIIGEIEIIMYLYRLP
ncbi:hypothetical protein H0R92_03455 [Treponema sp. OMZ 840]|uniref:hypothetical protein n=1 Tax=Treponema sp. OMZ 840 TaxID=244313 RepID=UPI003D91EA7F